MFENDELETSQNSLNSEFERSEGEGTWDNQEETNQETTEVDTNFGVDQDNQSDDLSQSDEGSEEHEETENQPETSDDSEEEQKNTPPEGIRRVLSYSEFTSSN